MTGVPSQLKIDVKGIVPPLVGSDGAPTPSPSVTPTAPTGAALAVYRPSAHEVAERLSSVASTLDTRLAPLTQKQKPVKVVTDWWAIPLLAGSAGALGIVVSADVATVVPWLVAGVGAALSTVGAIIHPKLRRQAAERAPPLLQGELREEVLRLENASRDFPAREAGDVQAPEVQAFVANKARALLARAKDAYWGTNDTEVVRVLERLASLQTTLAPEEERLLEFTALCLNAGAGHYGRRGIPAAFARLSDSQQRELAPFVRARFFNEDGLKHAVHGEDAAYLTLHTTLDAIGPKARAPYPTTPEQVPAHVATHGDVVASLGKLVHFDELFDWGERPYRNATHGPATAEKAVAFAIEPEHSGVERALFGIIAERHLSALRGFDFRLRAALTDVIATAAAEPPAVRDEAARIMQRVDTLAASFRTSTYSDAIDVPGMSLRKVVALLELAKGAL